MTKNTQGKLYYGIHFYPGVAQYEEPGKESYRVFLNEDTLRKMDPTFSGKPIFVEHVDEVEPSLDKLREEADGWVVRSFFNAKDGKHWVEMMIVSERGEQAVQKGMRLSNAYQPKSTGPGGLWNGVQYIEEITNGVYDHLAIVRHPRYEESIILTPEQFKEYNEAKEVELKKLANSKETKGENKMGLGLKFFKRSKVENSVDIESTVVELPKSKVEMTISELVTEMDIIKNMAGYANPDHMVKIGNDEMSVKDLMKKHEDCMNELEAMKKDAKSEEGGEPGKGADDEEKNSEASEAEDMSDVGDRGGDKHLNDEAEGEKLMEKKKNSEKASQLKNAQKNYLREEAAKEIQGVAKIDLSMDKVARGKARYGSN